MCTPRRHENILRFCDAVEYVRAELEQFFLLNALLGRKKQPIRGGEESPEACELKVGRVPFGAPWCHFPRSCACVILCWRGIYFCLLERRKKYPSVEWFERGLANREENKLNPFFVR